MRKRNHFRHLNQHDRDRIEALLNAGHTQKEIARVLKVDQGTVSREVRRRKKKSGRYEATAAQMKADLKRSNSKYRGMKIEKYSELKEYIITRLKDHRSPDEIAGRMKREERMPGVNTNAIYKWLYSVYGQAYCQYLCTKRYRAKKQKQPATRRTMIPNRISISMRPLGATNKTRYGHFEGDTVVAPKKADNTESIVLAAERKTNLLVGMKISSLSPVRMQEAIAHMESRVSMDSLSLDNGIENRSHESWNVPAYFCDPHSPWQKPHVENNIGLMRRWFIPKGTDFATISEEQLQSFFHIINHKYRRSLNYKSAYEVALVHGIIETIP